MDPNESENPEQLQEQLRRLEAQKAELEARLRAANVKTNGGAVIQGLIKTAGGDVVARDQWNINIHQGAYEGEPPKDDAEARGDLSARAGQPLRRYPAQRAG